MRRHRPIPPPAVVLIRLPTVASARDSVTSTSGRTYTDMQICMWTNTYTHPSPPPICGPSGGKATYGIATRRLYELALTSAGQPSESAAKRE